MNDPKWTPGPWIVTEDDRPGMEWNRAIALATNPHFEIAAMNHSDGKDPEGDAANAHLIAAAPELYGALKTLDQFASTYSAYNGSLLQKEVRIFLAKARGEDQ